MPDHRSPDDHDHDHQHDHDHEHGHDHDHGHDLDDLDYGYLTDEQVEAVAQLLEARLDAGPVAIADLLDEALAAGIIGPDILDLDDDELDAVRTELIEDLLLPEPDLWANDERIERIGRLLDGRLFTHRLTAVELDHHRLELWPDLCVMDLDLLPEGDPAAAVAGGSPALDVDQRGLHVLAVPAATLAGLSPGDLVAVGRRGHDLVVEPLPGPPDPGQAEQAALVAGMAIWIDLGGGVDALLPVMDALMTDSQLFTRPVPPLTELVAAAGLASDGTRFGPGDRIWDEVGFEQRLANQASSAYELDECCLDALALVNTRWRAEILGLADHPDAPPVEAVVDALGHSDVVPAFADVLDGPRHHDRLRAFARSLLEATADDDPRTLGPRLLAAHLHDRDGQLAEAEHLYRQVHDRQPDSPAAIEGLAFVAFDRSDFDTAARFLRRIYEPKHPLVETTEQLAALQVDVGRNDRCPCGSGRKYKACHDGTPFIPPEHRITVLLAKLACFAVSRSRRDRLAGTALLAGLEPESLLGSRFLFESYALDAGNAEDYRTLRGALLPPEEAELLARLIGLPAHLVEVVAVSTASGPGVTATAELQPVGAGAAGPLACDLTEGDPDLEPGQVGLVHLLDRTLVGQVALVDPDLRGGLGQLLAGGQPPLPDFLAWFADVPVS